MTFGNERNFSGRAVKKPAVRYCYEIEDDQSPDILFFYFDTNDHLAKFLFDLERIDVTVEWECGGEGKPYRVVLGRIPGDQRRAFLKAVELLPGLMENRGKGGYDEYCRDILETLSRLWDAERTIGSIPLQ